MLVLPFLHALARIEGERKAGRSANAGRPRKFPLTMECIVRDVQDWGGEKRFIGEIVNTRVDETVLDEEGRVDFARMHPIVYDSTRRIYRVVGEVVGGAWDAGKPLM